MTFLHFINSALLTFAPTILVFKTKLEETTLFKLFVYVIFGYLLTQLCQGLLIATFVPLANEESSESSEELGGLSINQIIGQQQQMDSARHNQVLKEQYGEFLEFELSTELMKGFIGITQFIGISLLLSPKFTRLPGKSDPRVRTLAIALVWTITESVVQRLLPLWFGSRLVEFSWSNIQLALEANIQLLINIACVWMLWCWSRNDLLTNVRIFLIGALSGLALYPLFTNFLALSLHWNRWYTLGAQAMFAFFLFLFSKTIRDQYEKQKQN